MTDNNNDAKKDHGRRRSGAGRPLISATPVSVHTISVTSEDHAYLIALGYGNLSVGVRKLIALYKAVSDRS